MVSRQKHNCFSPEMIVGGWRNWFISGEIMFSKATESHCVPLCDAMWYLKQTDVPKTRYQPLVNTRANLENQCHVSQWGLQGTQIEGRIVDRVCVWFILFTVNSIMIVKHPATLLWLINSYFVKICWFRVGFILYVTKRITVYIVLQ